MIMTKLTTPERLIDSQLQVFRVPRINGPFVRGPLPLSWISKAARLPGKSLNAGLACWYLMFLKKSYQFKLSNIVANEFGLNKDSKLRALKCLEEAGLIRCTRMQGRSVVIEMLNTDG
jgi:DNA-binding transcriptional ArsR family regulator